MELINNTTKTLKNDLSVEIKQGSKLSIAAACFSIYAFQELKEQLSQIEQLRFIFTSPTFVTEKAKKERREFYIPRLTRERSLYGTEFEIKLRNELTQKAIARECAEWIRQKVTFKSNVSDKSIQGQIVVDSVGYTPINNFTTVELGCEKGNVISTTIVKDESLARTLLADFNEIWNDSKVLQVVTDEVIDSITAAYNENSPDFIYFVTLYNIFNEFLEDVSEDVLPNEATGFKESKIWGMLYNFQKDAALAIINKLEKYNGCILADSVGLGKTFTALAVIKYYENRNKSVLVLCPKKLTNNWNTYKDNYVNNPIAADRLRYDVLYHTDLNRTHGTSNGLDLDRLNWGNYDLVVIDESHNFRNGGKLVENPDEDAKDNRYVTLMKKVIRAGVKTKVLMLSATPVNNRFNDLKNQLALAYEGHTDYIDEKLNTTRSIDEIFKNAQRAFNTWSKWEPCDRTTENLLKMLDFDFFEVLDSVTIARSRKHIQKYYDMADIGTFPTRLKPISLRPHLTDLKKAISYNEIFEQLMLLTLTIYTPTHYILPSKMEKYAELYGDNKVNVGFTQANREQGIRRLTAINLMKRMESSVYSFNLTLTRIKDLINSTIETIDRFDKHSGTTLDLTDISDMDEFDAEDQNSNDLFSFGKKVKIDLADMDYVSWRDTLEKDAEILELLTYMIGDITPEHDSKLQELFRVINNKITHPINGGNKKLIIFTAFADTADYLFQRLSVEYDGIYGTIDDYTSDANLMNYLFKLKEAISNADYDTIMYTLSGIDKWYDENIGAISSSVYICNLASHQKNMRLIKEILSGLKEDECVSATPAGIDTIKTDSVIFISHKSDDKKYGDALERFITGLGVKDNQLVYTSHPLHKIPLDASIYEYLRSHINSTLFMIILWSDKYLESPACLNEMGAAWVTQTDYTNIYVPSFSFGNPKYHECAVDTKKMGAVLNGDEHCKANMIELKNKIEELFNLKNDEAKVTFLLDRFIDEIKEDK